MYFLRQAFLKGVESFHQVFELLMCQFPGLLFVARPVETIAGSQSLVQKKVSVAFLSAHSDNEGLSEAFCYPHIFGNIDVLTAISLYY